MVYTIADIRALARSKDERLEDVDAYPDSWIDKQIDHAFEVTEDAKQVFSASQEYDVATDISNGVTSVEVTLDNMVHGIYSIICDTSITVEVTTANTVIITLPTLLTSVTNTIVAIKYFYYPVTPFESIDLPVEVYHLFRHSLYVNLYGSLRDKESEQYHQAQVDRFVKEGTFQMPGDFEDDTYPNYKTLWN